DIERTEGAATRTRTDRFRYDDRDRFPATDAEATDSESALGLVAGQTVRASAQSVADEIVRLLSCETVRDRQSGLRRSVRPADIAILFRSRDSHRDFEAALDRRGVPTYVYKGLGFFDAAEIQDTV